MTAGSPASDDADRPVPGDPAPSQAGRTLEVRPLGRMAYDEAHDLQRRLVEQRRSGAIGDTLLLVEHPPVITLGARNRIGASHILATDEQLRREGVSVHETGRGGDVTYHGPGQLVGYPILDLRPDRCDVHQYVRDLEAALIHALKTMGIDGVRVPGLSGVWVGRPGGEEKVAAIGIRISRWITSHGFALNVSTRLEHFDLIVPCGITGRGVTSIERLLGRPVPLVEAAEAVTAGMRQLFGASTSG